ncbi:oligoribonuclease [Legionella cincinnatiensis]|uniref:Oligoribonuclease n=1 Tax=Legionella cincinnatiensis TaxID=28085 RepID=A0A378IG88_9GAMM|nr:oligoribonuclease [Legionella cincinnatiensis]KTC91963.1 oligoribonuclease [Legionella cincinnatiensis]STX33735.1 oligoribonuclease [Legionella cincinnatiensis]
MKNNQNLIWIDLEMTGLNPEQDRIIELATVVTDPHLNIIAEGPVFAISQSKVLLDGMDSWNTKQHGQSGLVKRVLESDVSEVHAEKLTIEFLKRYLDKGKSPMCGNSICQDRRFLYKYMPDLASFFHYRNLDVSTLKELAIRWRPELLNGVVKESKHLALDDIKDSIAELVYYRKHFINLLDTTK